MAGLVKFMTLKTCESGPFFFFSNFSLLQKQKFHSGGKALNYPIAAKPKHKLRNVSLVLLTIWAAVNFVSAQAGETKCRQAREILTVEESGSTPWMRGAINDGPVIVEFDTGSTETALSEGTATRLNLPLSRRNRLSLGIGGSARDYVAAVKKFTFGPVSAKGLWPTVIGGEGKPANFEMLLGSDYLMNFDIEIFMAERKISFFRNVGCEDTYIARWDDNAFLADLEPWKSDEDHRPFITVELNGQKIRALIDTGASSSLLTTAAAAKAGVSLPPLDEKEETKFHGIGAMHSAARVVTFKSFSIGDETILNPKIFVGDIWANVWNDMKSPQLDELMEDMPDMLIGMDFIRAHRMLIAPSQKRLYFTYLGGPVFYADTPPAEAPKAAPQ